MNSILGIGRGKTSKTPPNLRKEGKILLYKGGVLVGRTHMNLLKGMGLPPSRY